MMDPQGSGSPMVTKAFDEVHLGGGKIAQQASRTFNWVFGYGLKVRKPAGDSSRRHGRACRSWSRSVRWHTRISTL